MAAAARMPTAAAFLSYVHFDDEHDKGYLTELCNRLAGEVRMQSGVEFVIFQDRKAVGWGQNWRGSINQSLDAVAFLIPILTPSFFRSRECRKELQRFLERERHLERDDLVFPVYYVDCPLLSNEAMRKKDSLANVIASRQYADWRALRFKPFTSPPARRTLAHLATQIRDAIPKAPHGKVAPFPVAPPGTRR